VFSIVVVLAYIPTSNILVFLFLYILVKTWHFLILVFSIISCSRISRQPTLFYLFHVRISETNLIILLFHVPKVYFQRSMPMSLLYEGTFINYPTTTALYGSKSWKRQLNAYHSTYCIPHTASRILQTNPKLFPTVAHLAIVPHTLSGTEIYPA
jgi:hypothetical protein